MSNDSEYIKWWNDNKPKGYARLFSNKTDIECKCTECEEKDDCYIVSCDVTVYARIYIRADLFETEIVKVFDEDGNPTGWKRVGTLSKGGKKVYGHEQMHIIDYQAKLRKLLDKTWEDYPATDKEKEVRLRRCKEQKRTLETELKKRVRRFILARRPGGGRKDITHGGEGQPELHEEIDPIGGAPGPYEGNSESVRRPR